MIARNMNAVASPTARTAPCSSVSVPPLELATAPSPIAPAIAITTIQRIVVTMLRMNPSMM